MRKQLTFTFALAAMSLLTTAARAEDEHRELGPHEHGHGTLNIAIEDKRVSMELEVPGMDIVGFEHAATTDDAEGGRRQGQSPAGEAARLFSLPAGAGCTVAEAKVAIEAEHHDDDDDKDADHDGRQGRR